MESFPPIHEIDHPAMPKSHLNALLIILMVTLFASGAALLFLKQIDAYHRQQLYIAEQAALPRHKEVKSSKPIESGWVVEGNNLKLPNFNNLSLNFPEGWYLALPKIENAHTDNMVFSALICNFKDCGNADKDKTPAGFSSFRIMVAPEYSEYRDEDIAKFADSKTNFKIKNGSAVFYEITKLKKNIEDLVLPTYSGLAMSEGKEFSKNYDVILTQGTRSKLENTTALKEVMLYTLKSVEFGQESTKAEAWKTYKNEEYGFEIQYPDIFKISENRYGSGTGFQVIFNSTIKENQNFQIKVSSDSVINKTSLENLWYLDFPPESKDVRLGGMKANYYEAPKGYCDGPGCSMPFVAILTKINSLEYVMEFSGDAVLDEQENRILSSFKFTK